MGAILRDFDQQLPPFLYMDTSFLLYAVSVLPDPTRHKTRQRECQRFWQKLKNKTTCREVSCLLSDLVLDECFYWIVRSHYEAELPHYAHEAAVYTKRTGKPYTWRRLYDDHPELVSDCMPTIEAVYDKLTKFPMEIVQPKDLQFSDNEAGEPTMAEYAKQMMSLFYLLPADAFHLAIAHRLGIDSIVTLDSDFQRVDGITMFTCL